MLMLLSRFFLHSLNVCVCLFECIYGLLHDFRIWFCVHSICPLFFLTFCRIIFSVFLIRFSLSHIFQTAYILYRIQIQRLPFIKRRCWKLIWKKLHHKPQTIPQLPCFNYIRTNNELMGSGGFLHTEQDINARHRWHTIFRVKYILCTKLNEITNHIKKKKDAISFIFRLNDRKMSL